MPTYPAPQSPPPLGQAYLTEDISYFMGLDLGQQQDYTALILLECRCPKPPQEGVRIVSVPGMGRVYEVPADPPKQEKPWKPLRHYFIRQITRFDHGTPYTTIIDFVISKFNHPALSHQTLAIDQTGVGRPVVEMFAKAKPKARIFPITITGGSAVSITDTGWRVAKKELISVCEVLLQSRRLEIAPSLVHAHTLTKELEMFKYEVTKSGNETFEAWREKDHDDMVLAVALAAWVSERGRKELWVK